MIEPPSPLILASSSPRRRELLAALGVAFEVVPSEVDESTDERDPARVAELLAVRKAQAVVGLASTPPGAVVIGSDTVVVLDGHILGKPRDASEARATLRLLRGRGHEVFSGVAAATGGRILSEHARTAVHMRPYTDEEVEAFIASGSPFDKAGGYAIQDEAFAPVERFEGCRCNVVGLPLATLRGLLASLGVRTARPAVECPICGADA